jgi:hypothetical protein
VIENEIKKTFFLLLILSSPNVMAESSKNYYFGAGSVFSESGYEGIYSDITQTLSAGTSVFPQSNSSSLAGEIYLGYKFSKNLAFELAYIKSSKTTYYFSLSSLGLSTRGSTSLSINGAEYSLVFHPIDQAILDRFFARLGGTYIDINSSNSVASSTSNGTGWLMGFGYDYPISDKMTLRTEYVSLRRIAGSNNYKLNGIGISVAGEF